MWKIYKVNSGDLYSNELLEIGLEYFYRENGGSQRVYATYVDSVLFITIHCENFSVEDLKLKIIQHIDFKSANETIKFVNTQYKVNIPLITQKDLDSIECKN